MRRIKYLLIIIFICSIFPDFSSAEPQDDATIGQSADDNTEYKIPYDLDDPDNVYNLPSVLTEVSGIAIYGENEMACIQDEKANIYIYNTQQRKITEKIDFGKNSDFEDLAIIGEDIYALRSDGTLFRIKNYSDKLNRKTVKIKTALGKKNDTEGLCFDKTNNSLLIACKGKPSIGKNKYSKGVKAVYNYDLNANKLIKIPLYLVDISKKQKKKYLGIISRFFVYTVKKLRLMETDNIFYPSAIAINPIDNDKIYILSSVGKKIAVLNRAGEVLELIELDRKLFDQPEGICFADNGDLYISNEGQSKLPNILKFNYSSK